MNWHSSSAKVCECYHSTLTIATQPQDRSEMHLDEYARKGNMPLKSIMLLLPQKWRRGRLFVNPTVLWYRDLVRIVMHPLEMK